jgi:DNA/RNA-binding domain of Phe-tRNA-synthetase-like protein
MALETGTYINSLNASNPVSTDGLSQADDHLRLIKSTIKSTFANIDGAVTSTEDDLNIVSGASAAGVTAAEFQYLNGVTSAIQTQFDNLTSAKANLSGASFTGAVDVNNTLTANALALDNGSSDWTFEVSSNHLLIKYAGTTKLRLQTDGDLEVTGNVTAYDTSI